MKVLGLETSCDETAASVVQDGSRLLSNVVASSMDLHAQYGGVVPEIAARSHIEVILPVIDQALAEASCTWDDIDAIAVTHGAGLGGSLLIGVLTARTLALTMDKPLYGINHVEAHVYANFLTSTTLLGYSMRTTQPEFPMLAVIVSGGHTQLALFEDHFNYRLLGRTTDDAIGEAFDKVAKILGLPYPGGPSVSKAALQGDPHAYQLPMPAAGKYDFSFSGLKTAVLRLAQREVGEDYTFPSLKLPERLSEAQKANIAASFEWTATTYIANKVALACQEHNPASIVVAGGVAANQMLRERLGLVQTTDLKHQVGQPFPIEYPDPKLCTDNGAMVATLGCFKAMRGAEAADPYSLDINPNLSM